LNHLHRRLRDELLHVGALAEACRHRVERRRERPQFIPALDVERKVEVAGGNLLRTLDQARHRRRHRTGQHRAGADANGKRQHAKREQPQLNSPVRRQGAIVRLKDQIGD
jgi:hypothetical protein